MGKHVAIMTPAQRASEGYALTPANHGFIMNPERSWVSHSGTAHNLYEHETSFGDNGYDKQTGAHSKFVVRTFCSCGNDLGAYNL